MRLPLLRILLVALAFLPKNALADPLIFDDLGQFLAATHAQRDSDPYPTSGSGTCLAAGQWVAEVCATSTALRYGDFSSALPLNGPAEAEFTVVGRQDFDITFQSPGGRPEKVFAFGIELDETEVFGPSPQLLIQLVSGGKRSAPYFLHLRGYFFGIWSDLPFDRVEIRDVSQVVTGAYFGPLYVGLRALAAPHKRTTALSGSPRFLGSSLALSGDTLVAGSERQTVVMERRGRFREWGTTATLGDPLSLRGVDISDSVAVDGDLIAVGDFREGEVTLFGRDVGGPNRWGEITTLSGGGGVSDGFGASVSVAGDTVVVGAPGEDGGAVYIFSRDAGGADAWGLVARLVSPTSLNFFGLSMSLSGDTLAVGSPQDREPALRAGRVYIFERDAGGSQNWGETAQFSPAGVAAGHEFGYALSLDEDRVLVVAPGAGPVTPPGPVGNSGIAYIFERAPATPASWVQVAELALSNGPQPFYLPEAAAALAGDLAVVGVHYDAGHGLDAGAALVFGKNEGGPGAWGLQRRITPPDFYPRDLFGFSVGTDGETVMVGAPFDDDRHSNSGAVYIFPPSLFRDDFELGVPSRWTFSKVD